MYGASPIKLLKKMKINTPIKIIVWPKEALGPTKTLNSVFSWDVTILNNLEKRLGWTQKLHGIISNPTKDAAQLRGRFKELTGSKMENKLVIIFN